MPNMYFKIHFKLQVGTSKVPLLIIVLIQLFKLFLYFVHFALVVVDSIHTFLFLFPAVVEVGLTYLKINK